MSDISERLPSGVYTEKLISARKASELIEDSMLVAVSGFTPAGCPKQVPAALAREVREGRRKLRIGILSGASTGPEIDDELGSLGVIERRYPYITSRPLRDMINGRSPEKAREGTEIGSPRGGAGFPGSGTGNVRYMDQHLGMVAEKTRRGVYGHVDIAIIEASAVLASGGIVPGTGIGCAQAFIDAADRVIIELNTFLPEALYGMHDIYDVADPPNRRPIPLTAPGERIGRTFLRCPEEKIAAIVIGNSPERARALAAPSEMSDRIASHIIKLLEKEEAEGRLSPDTVPLQSGVGSVANAVLRGLQGSRFENLTFYSEVLQDGVLDLMDEGRVVSASGTSLSLSEEGMRRLFSNFDFYRDRIVLRNSDISNSAEIIGRLGVISMNTAIEVDIYGHADSSHINGTDIMNGIGGSGDYARNAALTIFMTPSTAKGGRISSIVPMVTHVDHTAHDTDIVVTEQGLADLRGLSPKEKAQSIIENCAHPDYRPLLSRYFEDACVSTGFSQTPHILERCFSLHENFARYGTMLPGRD